MTSVGCQTDPKWDGNNPDFVIYSDVFGNIHDIKGRFEEITGIERGDLIGRNYTLYMHPKSIHKVMRDACNLINLDGPNYVPL